jgi:ribosomal protein L7/L12
LKGDIPTTPLARVPRVAAISIRGGVLALLARMRGARLSRGDLASVQRIALSLGRLKGVAMKVGQHLSYVDGNLPDEARAVLSALLTHSQPMPIEQVTEILERELGPQAAPLLAALEPAPISSASIGQVHRARLPGGSRVAVKVQYPGIVEAIRTDFGPASLAGRFASLLYPGVEIEGFLREARARVLEECDYRAEARHQADMASRFAGHPLLTIPSVHPTWSTGRVLTTSFFDGVDLDELFARGASQEQRDRIGSALYEFYVGSLARWGLLNGDPHPGNYLFDGEGRVAIVDHGSSRRFDATGEELARRVRVLEADDRASAYRASAGLGGEALLLLRVRFGLASVLERLEARNPHWREPEPAAPSAPAPAPAPRAAAAPPARRRRSRRATSAPAPAPAAPVAFEVVLVDAGQRTIEIVREVRDATGLSIREAVDLIEQSPHVVERLSDRGAAEALKRRLENCGATVELRSGPPDAPRPFPA